MALKATKKGKSGMTKQEVKARKKAGKRDADSDSDYSYRSVYSPGGTRHVKRRRKRPDGTYSDSESYHSDQDKEGESRRRRRRRQREHGPGSAHSYYSVESEGGTRHVRRKRRHEDGTYSDSESYKTASDDDEVTEDGDSSCYSSDYSYASETSEGGTRYETKKKRIRDDDGNVIGYGETKVREVMSETESVKTRRGSIDANLKSLLAEEAQVFQQNLANPLFDVEIPAGEDEAEPMWPGESLRTPSDFSDDSTDDENVDLSNMSESEKQQYFKKKEKRRLERERRRREKYGSKYDEIMKKREEKKVEEMLKEKEEQERLEMKDKEEMDQKNKERRPSVYRQSTSSLLKSKEVPKSMVTYEKGRPRDYGPKKEIDTREHGLGHEMWGKNKPESRSRRGSTDYGEESQLKIRRETTLLKKLPSIPQGKLLTEGGEKLNRMKSSEREVSFDDSKNQEIDKNPDDEEKNATEYPPSEHVLEVGADGKLRLKKKRIDISELDDDTLRKLGMDPNSSAVEIAKKLKEMFGKDVKLTIGGEVIGTKELSEYHLGVTDEQLAADEDLDITTLKGKRRVNILFRRGGSALHRHLQRIIQQCNLMEKKRTKTIDEDAAIDFLTHYRLVDPTKVDNYAKAFVIEDADFDTVLNINAMKIALEGVESIERLTQKQREYVLKVLHIDEATEVTFRMFAVISALCERVTCMDALSQQLLEICNMADIERKLELYKAMFYHNIPSYRDTNFITSDSLTIELMAGGLDFTQQKFIMEKLEPNNWGDISFLDYMCYIPLFMSLHDNICDNPLDMSDKKYKMPPRKRPPSVQRDMNPLNNPLKKTSTHLMKRKANELMEKKYDPKIVSKEELETLNKYAKLPEIFTKKPSSPLESGRSTSFDLIY